MRRFAESYPINITIFESKSYIGGRSTTVNVFDDPSQPVELGASIFVTVNHNLVNAAKEFGLDVSDTADSRPDDDNVDSLGVYDGSQFVFRQPRTEGKAADWWSLAKLLWKYGPLAPIRTKRLMESTIGKFLGMYEAPLFPFVSLSSAVEEAGLLDATTETGIQFLEKNGITGGFATDLIQASTRVNYGQNLGLIHGLETMVCMAAEGAVSVEGGNWRIFSSMVDASKADARLETKVTTLKQGSGGDKTWLVTSVGPDGKVVEEEYDTVVLASPYQFADLTITPISRTPDKIPYVTLHVTLFTSPRRLDPAYFGLQPGDLVPGIVITTLNATEQADEQGRWARGEGKDGVGNVGFFSISTLRSLVNFNLEPSEDGARKGRFEYLYKVFSPEKFSDKQLHAIIGAADADDAKVSWIYRHVWQAYPYLYPRVTFEDPILGDNLWYTSGIESFISTMETSSLMGMNVARLVVDGWIREGEQDIQL